MIGIVILNYLTWSETLQCVDSITNNYKKEHKIYIVDNKSPNESSDMLIKSVEDRSNIEFLQADENRGYAAGNNIGIKRAIEDECKYILIANSDVIFLKGSIDLLADYLNSDPVAGIAAPSTFDSQGNNSTQLRNKVVYLWQLLLASTFLRRKLNISKKVVFIDPLQYSSPVEIDVLSGCCLMFRKEVFETIDLLDESTFLYSEEYIIERRLSTSMYKSFFVPKARVIHNHGTSTKQVSLFSFMKSVESGIYYAKSYLKLPLYKVFVFYTLKTLEFIHIAIKEDNFLMKFKDYLSKTISVLIKPDTSHKKDNQH